MRPFRTVMFLSALLVLCGCAPKGLVSSMDPQASGTSFTSLLVLARMPDASDRMTAENMFAFRLARTGVEAVPSMRVLTPNQRYTEKDAVALLRKNGIQAVLVVAPGGRDRAPDFRKHELNPNPGQWKDPGAASLAVSLWDVREQRTVWSAYPRDEGSAQGNDGLFGRLNRLAEASAIQLVKDGLLGQ